MNQSFKVQGNISTDLKLIFLYYCTYGDRQNCTVLKHQGYKRLLSDAQLIPQPNIQTTYQTLSKDSKSYAYDILYHKQKQKAHGLYQHDLIQMLPELSQVAYPNLQQQQRLPKVILIHFQTLSDFILHNTELGQDYLQLHPKYLTQQCFRLLIVQQNKNAIYKLYTHYFPKGRKKNLITFDSEFNLLFAMMKDLQLVPKFTQKSSCYLIYRFLISQKGEHAFQEYFPQEFDYLQVRQKYNKQQEENHKLTPFAFIKYLIMLSRMTHKRISKIELSSVRKLSNLLERIQLSKGYMKLSKTQKMDLNLSESLLFKIQNSINPNSSNKQSPEHKSSGKISKKHPYSNTNKQELLEERFQKLCIYGQTSSRNILTEKKVTDLIISTGIYDNSGQNLNNIKAQLQILMKGIGTITFPNFMCLLYKLSTKKNIPLYEIIMRINILEDYQLPIRSIRRQISPSNQNTKIAIDILYSQPVINHLQTVFHHYCQFINTGHNGDMIDQLDLVNYCKLMYDFGVCPLIADKSALVQAYSQCSQSLNQGSNSRHSPTANIQFNQFLESIIVLTTFRQYQKSQIEKTSDQILILILQTMHSSRGNRTLKKQTQQIHKLYTKDYMDYVRSNFLNSYQNFTLSTIPKKKLSQTSSPQKDLLIPYLK